MKEQAIKAPSEHQVQAAFIEWCQLQSVAIEGLDAAFAVPNGGHRHMSVAKRLKAEGVVPGQPDWQWPVARGAFIGLAIEFKAGDGVPSKEQRTRIASLQRGGWCVVICWDWQSAARTVQGYAGMLRVQL